MQLKNLKIKKKNRKEFWIYLFDYISYTEKKKYMICAYIKCKIK